MMKHGTGTGTTWKRQAHVTFELPMIEPRKQKEPQKLDQAVPQRKLLYTIKEASEQLGVSRSTFYRMLTPKYPGNYRPELVVVELGGLRLVPHKSLVACVNNILREQGLSQYIEHVD